MRKERGVTLIALIITIIIMIIIAAVAIATLTGDSGIMTTAQEAKVYNAYAAAREQMRLSQTTVKSRIQFEYANNATYDATEDAAEMELLILLMQDYVDSDEFTFYLDSTASVLYMLYTDSAIDAEAIDDGEPLNDHYVIGMISLDAQNCKLSFDEISVTMVSNSSKTDDGDYFDAKVNAYAASGTTAVAGTTVDSETVTVGDFEDAETLIADLESQIAAL